MLENALVLDDKQQLQPGQHTILIPPIGLERIRIGSGWFPASKLTHGQTVDEISYFGRYSVKPGDTLAVSQPDDTTVVVEVLSLRFVESDQLGEDDFRALGYSSRADYEQARRRSIPDKAWLAEIAILDGDRQVAPAEADVLNEVMTSQEVAATYDLSESTVRVNIHREKIPARKSGGTWLIRRKDAEARWGKLKAS